MRNADYIKLREKIYKRAEKKYFHGYYQTKNTRWTVYITRHHWLRFRRLCNLRFKIIRFNIGLYIFLARAAFIVDYQILIERWGTSL